MLLMLLKMKKKIKGRQIQPNQKPIAAKSFASQPIPSIFFNFYKKIINQIIVYPATPPMIEFDNQENKIIFLLKGFPKLKQLKDM